MSVSPSLPKCSHLDNCIGHLKPGSCQVEGTPSGQGFVYIAVCYEMMCYQRGGGAVGQGSSTEARKWRCSSLYCHLLSHVSFESFASLSCDKLASSLANSTEPEWGLWDLWKCLVRCCENGQARWEGWTCKNHPWLCCWALSLPVCQPMQSHTQICSHLMWT